MLHDDQQIAKTSQMASKIDQIAAKMDPKLLRNGVWSAWTEQESTILIFFEIHDAFWEAFGAI